MLTPFYGLRPFYVFPLLFFRRRTVGPFPFGAIAGRPPLALALVCQRRPYCSSGNFSGSVCVFTGSRWIYFCGWCGVAMRAPTLGAALEHACNRHSVLLCRGAFAPIARCSFSCRQPISCPQSNCLFDGNLVMRISVIGHGHKCQQAHCPQQRSNTQSNRPYVSVCAAGPPAAPPAGHRRS